MVGAKPVRQSFVYPILDPLQASHPFLLDQTKEAAHLVLHDRLLEPGATHRHIPWLLTSTPHVFSIWGLQLALGLRLLRHLLQFTVNHPSGCDRQRIGLRNILGWFMRVWVVGGHTVIVGDFGRICSERSWWNTPTEDARDYSRC